jgi:hypothetical protein
MSLQDAFYIIGIVFMSLMFIIMLATVIAVFVIKAKINSIQRHLEEKLHAVVTIAQMSEAIIGKFKK